MFERLSSHELGRYPRVAKLATQVAARTGLWFHIRPSGLAVLLRGLVRQQTNPSLLYRFQASTQPDKPAVIWRDRIRTFRELDDQIEGIGHGLRAKGIGRGARVVIMLENRPELIALQPAMSRMGAAAVNISWRSTPSELAYFVNHSGAQAMFFEHHRADVVREAMGSFDSLASERMFCVGGPSNGFSTYDDLLLRAPKSTSDAADDDAAVIIYTSGTTGRPKGAVRKFPRDVVEGTLQVIASSPLRADDVHLAVLPLYHSTAYAFTNFSHLIGATVVLMDRFEPEKFLAAVQEHGVTQTAIVPTLLHRIVQLGDATVLRYDTGTLRAIMMAGAPLGAELALRAMDVFGDVLYNYYGATETGLNTMAGPEDLRGSPGTIGRVIPGNEIRLLDDDGRAVPRGQVGELWARGPLMVEGYHGDEAATKSSLREGFFSVWDLAWIDERGCYHLAGRKRDMIISGGVNVYPAEVERVLESHPSIAEAAVIGLPDDEWGERVCAVVVPKPEAGDDVLASLEGHCREQLAGPKRPRQFEVVDALPRNPTGKVLKAKLQERFG
ncbi:MAG: class I adenylate-forming enzyme family protein [Myxococcota bacterium]